MCFPQFEREGIPARTFNAMTGGEARARGWRTFDRLTEGHLGCLASHLAVWREICDVGAPYGVIHEDDVVLMPGFAETAERLLESQPDWELFQLGWFTSVRYPARVRVKIAVADGVRRRLKRYRPRRSLFLDGAHAYAIRASLARELLDVIDVA